MGQNGKLDVYLAVGHGVEQNGLFDPGAIGTDGRQEHQEAFQVCPYALAAMRRSGLSVVSETAQGAAHDPDFMGSTNRANALHPRVAIEVHFDFSQGGGRIFRAVQTPPRAGLWPGTSATRSKPATCHGAKTSAGRGCSS